MGRLELTFGIENMSHETKDKLIAPKISQLISPDFPDISDKKRHPLNSFIFNFELSLILKNKYRQYVFNIVRKSCDAFDEYCEATSSLKEFINNKDKFVPSYFSAVCQFEHCVAHINQAVVCLNALSTLWNGPKQFNSGDGSILDRVNLIHRDIKHMDERFGSADGADKRFSSLTHVSPVNTTTIPMWLTNEGLESISAKVTYHELAQEILGILQDACEMAKIQRERPYQTPQSK